MLDHEQDVGGDLLADSLTGLVSNGLRAAGALAGPATGRGPGEHRKPEQVEAAAHPELEVRPSACGEGEPLSLAPVTGLPRLRTLTAYPGTLADPLEIAERPGSSSWNSGRRIGVSCSMPKLSRVACRPPPSRSTAPATCSQRLAALANELLALWDRPPITRTTLEGNLGPVA